MINLIHVLVNSRKSSKLVFWLVNRLVFENMNLFYSRNTEVFKNKKKLVNKKIP